MDATNKKLNKWINAGARSDTDDIIDDVTGLSLSDIRNSLVLLTVESVREIKGIFSKVNLGKITKINE